MSGSFIQALQRKPWEKHVQTNAKSTFLAQNALPSPTLVPGSPHDDGSGLPTAASGGNISPERPVIRWMSGKMWVIRASCRWRTASVGRIHHLCRPEERDAGRYSADVP